MPAANIQVKTCQHFINGEYVAAQSGETFDSINPATGEILARVAKGDAVDVDRAVQAAKRAFEAMMQMTKIDISKIEWAGH